MEFTDLVGQLFKLQDAYPDLRWDVDGYNVMSITFGVEPENADLLMQGRRMFEPVNSAPSDYDDPEYDPRWFDK